MKVIKFLKSNSPYHKNDIAGFDDAIADKAIKAKIAVDYSKEAAKERKAKAAEIAKTEDEIDGEGNP